MRYLLASYLLVTVTIADVRGQSDPSSVSRLQERVTTLEREIDRLANAGLVMFLFGAFCALWAQNTNRSAFLWFFFGLLTGPLAVFILLWKNSNDRNVKRAERLAELESMS